VAAMTDYTKANLALMQQGSPAMSVEATIAQRRLEEEFCLRSFGASSTMRTACDLRRRSTLVSVTKPWKNTTL
jgi:hypothetical protein